MTARTILTSAASFFLLAFCAGCSTPMLVPDLVQVPLMQKQGDVHLQIHYGTNGATGSVAVSPLPNIALLGSYSRAWSKEERTGLNSTLKDLSHGHELVEASLGGYLPSVSLSGQNATLELYGGMMIGTVRGGRGFSGLTSNIQIVDANAREVFVRLNMGVRDEYPVDPVGTSGQPSVQILEYGTCFKFSNWQVTDFTYDGVPAPAEKQEGNYLQTSIFARWPGRFFFWEFQTGFLYPLSNNSNRPSIASLYISIGVHFNVFPGN